jgi:hypothetical protein
MSSGLSSAFSSITGSSSLGNALFGGITARREWKYKKKAMALEQQYNLENMQKQYEYQQDAWNQENEYNDPSAVRDRYASAGISAQAALGGAASGAGLATSMDTPSSDSPSAGGNYAGNVSVDPTAISQITTQRALADFYEAQADKVRSETYTNEFNKQCKEAQNRMNDSITALNKAKVINEEQSTRLTQLNADFYEAIKNKRIETYDAQCGKLLNELDILQFNKEHLEDNYRVQIESMRAQIVETYTRAELDKAQTWLAHASVKEVEAKVTQIYADVGLTKTQQAQIQQQIDSDAKWLDKKQQATVKLLIAQTYATRKNADTNEYNADTARIDMYWRNGNDTARVIVDIAKTVISAYSKGLIGSGSTSSAPSRGSSDSLPNWYDNFSATGDYD